jgi:hypothetical protein
MYVQEVGLVRTLVEVTELYELAWERTSSSGRVVLEEAEGGGTMTAGLTTAEGTEPIRRPVTM